MKKLSSLSLFASALLLVGCNSLDNPFGNLFKTGRDERIFNPQTGQYEWPNRSTPAPRKSAEVASALAAGATPKPESEGRYFDPQKNEWVEIPKQRTSSSSKPKPTPAPTAPAGATASAASTAPQAEAPQPRAAHARGVYNPSTGKIEWQSTSGEMMPAPTPAPESKKHWYLPF